MIKTYSVEYSKHSKKQLEKIDRLQAIRIKKWIERNLIGCENPYFSGKALEGNLRKYWRYRVGNYRIITEINNKKILILIVNINHRKNVYNINY